MERAARHDRYGAPLPELAEASRQALHDTPANLTQRRHIQAVLEETYRVLLRRDMNADVTVSFKVVQGRIQDDVRVGVERQYRCSGEE
jgi:hypothetical protein